MNSSLSILVKNGDSYCPASLIALRDEVCYEWGPVASAPRLSYLTKHTGLQGRLTSGCNELLTVIKDSRRWAVTPRYISQAEGRCEIEQKILARCIPSVIHLAT